MSAWQVGDLAVGVEDFVPCSSCEGSDEGDLNADDGVCRVVQIDPPEFTGDTCGLRFAGAPAGEFYCECGWRKIHPDEQKSCEAEFVTLLKRIKPKVRA